MKFKFILISSVVTLLVFLLSISIGIRENTFSDVIATIVNYDPDNLLHVIIVERMLRTLTGFIAGAALAASGVLIQITTKNPITDPSILGVSAGASLFVIIGIIFFSISLAYQYIFMAVLGAFVALCFVFLVAHLNGGITPIKLVLSGAIINMITFSVLNILMLSKQSSLNDFRFWQVGSLGGATLSQLLVVLFLVVICFIVLFLMMPTLNVYTLGDEIATSLGVNVKKWNIINIILCVILCGSITAICGPIAFIGLMIPHLIRLLKSNSMQTLIPLSMVAGANALVIFDIIGRYLGTHGEIQVGIISAIVGAPIFVLIARNAKVKGL